MIDFKRYQSVLPNRVNSTSFVELEVNRRLLDKLDFINFLPESILDLGCGNAEGVKLLASRFPKADIHGLDMCLTTSDASWTFTQSNFNYELPYPAHTFDLVIANLSLQAAENIYTLLDKLYTVMKPGGMLLFSMLAEESLPELIASWAAVDSFAHHNPFISTQSMAGLLQSSVFTDTVIDCEYLMFEYSKVGDAVRDIREIKEPLALKEMRKTLTGKGRWRQFERYWSDHFSTEQKKIVSTYHIMYGHACKPKKVKLKQEDNEAKIGLADLAAYLKQGQR